MTNLTSRESKKTVSTMKKMSQEEIQGVIKKLTPYRDELYPEGREFLASLSVEEYLEYRSDLETASQQNFRLKQFGTLVLAYGNALAKFHKKLVEVKAELSVETGEGDAGVNLNGVHAQVEYGTSFIGVIMEELKDTEEQMSRLQVQLRALDQKPDSGNIDLKQVLEVEVPSSPTLTNSSADYLFTSSDEFSSDEIVDSPTAPSTRNARGANGVRGFRSRRGKSGRKAARLPVCAKAKSPEDYKRLRDLRDREARLSRSPSRWSQKPKRITIK